MVISVDSIAIDTNVFLHLLNPDENPDQHIDKLLLTLLEFKTDLLVDDRNRITGEYSHQIGQRIRSSFETGNAIYLLRYWLESAKHRQVELNIGDSLMRTIRGVILEHSEAVDRIFVYVAFKSGRVLISNDENHIVFGPPSERHPNDRRTRLLNATRRHRPNGADILTSREASDEIST